jgi:hypothetical protein
MSTDNPSSVSIQTDASPIASVPAWFGEVALLAHTLTRLGLLAEISERVRFVRKRFGTFEGIDFVVMLMGYALSGEPTRHPPITSACSHLPPRLWLCSDAAAYLIVPRLSSLSCRTGCSNSGSTPQCVSPRGTCSPQTGSGRGRAVGSASNEMDCLRPRWHPTGRTTTCSPKGGRICHHRNGVCLRSVRPATRGASVGRSSAPGPRSYRPIPISGSSPVEQPAMESIEASCYGDSP